VARVLKEHEERRTEILDAAQELFFRKGYDETSINDILEKVGVSKGTFYYYFASKAALLDQMAERHARRHLADWRRIIDDPGLNALEKLNTVFARSRSLKAENRDMTLLLLRVYYREENDRLRRRFMDKLLAIAADDLARVVEQGVSEGLFDTPYPHDAIRIIFGLSEEVTRDAVDLIEKSLEDPRYVEKAVERYRICGHAMERILGAAPGSIRFLDPDSVRVFFGGSEGAGESAGVERPTLRSD
jgi:AcrR family transcriptional regulator